jgi:hypothetical protein
LSKASSFKKISIISDVIEFIMALLLRDFQCSEAERFIMLKAQGSSDIPNRIIGTT